MKLLPVILIALLFLDQLHAVPMASWEGEAQRAELIVNGRIKAITLSDDAPPSPYQLSNPPPKSGIVEVEVLATLKGSAPKPLTFISSLPQNPDLRSIPLKQGQRYTFLLMQHEGQWITLSPYGTHFSIMALADDQADDAPLLLDSRIDTIARAEFARHRSEPAYATTYIHHLHEETTGWRVSFLAYLSMYDHSSVELAGEYHLSRDGEIINGWVASEELRLTPKESDIGQVIRITLPTKPDSENPNTPRSYFGTLKSISPTALTGDFFCLEKAPRLKQIPMAELLGLQRLALAPKPPPSSPPQSDSSH